MEPNTAVQRPSSVATGTASPMLTPLELDAMDAETEYGCVDWYPYMMAANTRTEWFDYDSGLAVG
jgi:hypothetical protein